VIVTVVRLAMPSGLRSVAAESVLVRHQLLILNRGRKLFRDTTLNGIFIRGTAYDMSQLQFGLKYIF
jgi:hypothetical protein